ncbi:MAG: site-2 protease family protein [Acidobacteria bacterium]|nr:site-2 protease family protein [Acidobacteriota bacterium]
MHGVLLAATLVTTTVVGAGHWISFQADFRPEIPEIGLVSGALHGLWYALTIMAILGAHELGHYLACRYYGISASLPYFLPVPFPLTGTAGAFIRIRQPITSKPALFDIGVAGPFAGFAVAVPALFIGLMLSRVVEVPADFVGMSLGEPLLFKAAAWMVWGSLPGHLSVNLHPMAFAAWFGLLATALNLFPLGQFDGGHVAYAALGRRSAIVSLLTLGAAVGLSFYSSSWIVWTLVAVGLLFVFGWRHPRTWDEDVPLDRTRLWLAICALIVFIVCFTPAPIEPLDLIQPK